MILATDLQGNLLIFNPAAERMLGYRFHEVLGQLNAHDLFPEGELERVGQLLVSRLDRSPAIDLDSVSAELKHYVQYVTSFPVSRVRGFEILCRRKDATTFPAMVYLSAVRNTEGALTGLLAIATDLTATKRAEHALRESEERYRDLFDNSQEMIATLSPRAKYLYVNPAWQTCFGKSAAAFESLISFEAAFPPEMQANAASLFDRALRGERIDRANLRVQDANGMYRELEASLSCRQDRGEPVSVRCIFRDVTAQYQRERRLAMQLAVSQVVGESTTSDEALPAMLESLGTNLGFDMAGLWFVSSDHHCRYLAGWYAPDRACIEFHRDSIGRVLQKGKDLPGQIWAAESPCWIEDQIGQAFGDDVPGQDRVDRDAAGRQLDGGGAHETQLAGLARAVSGPARVPGDRPGDRRGEDDPAAARALQRVQAGLDREHRALQVGAEDLVEQVLGHVRQQAVGEDARIGTQHVDTAQPLDGVGRHPPAVLPAGHIGLDERDLRAVRAQFLGGGPGDVRIPAGDQDPGSVAGEHAGDALADAAGAAGYHHGASGERCEHAFGSFQWVLRYDSARSQLPCVYPAPSSAAMSTLWCDPIHASSSSRRNMMNVQISASSDADRRPARR